MRYLLIGDIHLSDIPPSSRTASYTKDILDKMEWIVNKANEEKVDALISLGDVFHLKNPSRNSFRLVTNLANLLEQSKAPVVIVPGNHDVRYDDMQTLPSQPLGALAMHPNITLLMGPHSEFPLYGIPYFDHTPANMEYWLNKYNEDGGADKYPFIITHLSLFPEAQAPIYDYIPYEWWFENFKNPWTAYGHIHGMIQGGPFYKSGNQWLVNAGAISRGSLHEETIKRKPLVTLFDSDDEMPFTAIPVPFRPPEEVFMLDVVEAQKQARARAEAFLESLGSTELNYLTVEGIIEEAGRRGELNKQAVTELEDIVTSALT